MNSLFKKMTFKMYLINCLFYTDNRDVFVENPMITLNKSLYAEGLLISTAYSFCKNDEKTAVCRMVRMRI